MNAVEIEAAISDLALLPFDATEFPFAFLAAFGNKDTICKTLRASPATSKAKAKFIFATDGQTLEAEELAGISTVKEIKDNPVDVRATGRLNKLYVELLRDNPDWAKDERRADMNHFMARLVFCFFAEDTDIFNGDGLFTQIISQFSEPGASNTHEVLSEIFRAMNTKPTVRAEVQPRLPSWADQFPFVNGGLFSGSTEVPRFTRMALIASRLHLVWIGTVCGKLKTDFRYSNTLGWNTFPVPPLTEQNNTDLTACAEAILLAREAHFPATIADLYDPDTMPENLRAAHARNDEVLERIYIGRRFKNDTERLEKLFELYTKMTAADKSTPAKKATKGRQA